MKRLLYMLMALVLLIGSDEGQAQPPPCPTAGSFAVLPPNPTIDDIVRLTWPNHGGTAVGATWERTGSVFAVAAGVTNQGGLGGPPPGGLIAQFGQLAAGTYQVNVSANSNTVPCPNTVSFTFTVQGTGAQATGVPATGPLGLGLMVVLMFLAGIVGLWIRAASN